MSKQPRSPREIARWILVRMEDDTYVTDMDKMRDDLEILIDAVLKKKPARKPAKKRARK